MSSSLSLSEDVGAAAGGLVHELEEQRATFTT